MKQHLLPESGQFYKANLHCHSTVSDGKLTPSQLKALYQKYGYSIIAYTDHEVFLPHNDLTDRHFLALNGVELGVEDNKLTGFGVQKKTHLCCIALDESIVHQPCYHRSDYLFDDHVAEMRRSARFDDTQPDYVRVYSGEGVTDLIRRCRDKGFFVTYNHPTWSYEDFSDYMHYHGMDALEIFNGSGWVEGYDDYNPRVYDDLLRGGRRLYAIGADDNHNFYREDCRRFDSAQAFTVIKAPALTYAAVANALRQGHFYASEGPEIYALWVEDGAIHIRCSAVDRIHCTYGIRLAQPAADENGLGLREAVFPLPSHYGYFRLTLIDKQGRKACTNAWFEEDIL